MILRSIALVSLLCLAFRPGHGSDRALRLLEARASEVDIVDHPDHLQYATIYFELGQAYLDRKQTRRGMAALRKALLVDAWNFPKQLELARLEVREDPTGAARRLDWVAERTGDPDLEDEARKLLAGLPAGVRDLLPSPRARLMDHQLLVAGFEGADPTILAGIAAVLEAEFGVRCRVLPDRLDPDATNRSSPRHREIEAIAAEARGRLDAGGYARALALLHLSPDEAEGPEGREVFVEWYLSLRPEGQERWKAISHQDAPQFDSGVLIGQIVDQLGARPDDPGVLGLIGFTGEDLFNGAERFVFSLAGPTLGVASFSRVGHVDVPRHILLERAAKLALGAAGHVIPIGDCPDPTCPRSPPSSLEDLDRKSSHLCSACLEKLESVYDRRRSATLTRR